MNDIYKIRESAKQEFYCRREEIKNKILKRIKKTTSKTDKFIEVPIEIASFVALIKYNIKKSKFIHIEVLISPDTSLIISVG